MWSEAVCGVLGAHATAGRMQSTTLIDLGQIAQRLGLPIAAVEVAVRLLDEGNTVPFITRYRRDQTGGLDEIGIRLIAESVGRARQLADRKQTILRTIQGQGKLTPELESRIAAAGSSKQLEDLYLPFKPRKLSLAEIARQRRLEPLAREIIAADPAAADLDRRAADFLDPDSQVTSVADVLLKLLPARAEGRFQKLRQKVVSPYLAAASSKRATIEASAVAALRFVSVAPPRPPPLRASGVAAVCATDCPRSDILPTAGVAP